MNKNFNFLPFHVNASENGFIFNAHSWASFYYARVVCHSETEGSVNLTRDLPPHWPTCTRKDYVTLRGTLSHSYTFCLAIECSKIRIMKNTLSRHHFCSAFRLDLKGIRLDKEGMAEINGRRVMWINVQKSMSFCCHFEKVLWFIKTADHFDWIRFWILILCICRR